MPHVSNPSMLPGESMTPFSGILPLIRAADGLTLSQVCALTQLEPSTIQNWIKRGFVPHPVSKKYRERHLSRILLVAALRDSLQIDAIGGLLCIINGDADDESDDIIREEELYDCLCRAVDGISRSRNPSAELDAVITRVTRDYDPPDADAAERLRGALGIMTRAYAAGRLKRMAEQDYIAFTEKYEDHQHE